jgi:hypothetical protein
MTDKEFQSCLNAVGVDGDGYLGLTVEQAVLVRIPSVVDLRLVGKVDFPKAPCLRTETKKLYVCNISHNVW